MDSHEWKEFPTYTELLRALFEYFSKQLLQTRNNAQVKCTLLHYTVTDILFVILASTIWTFLRHFSTEKILKPLGRRYMLTPSNQQKMPESAWKLFYSVIISSFNFYILILSGEYNFFQKPLSVWEGWSLENSIPIKMYIFYVAQCGFYFHSLYAVLFMDTWKKDTVLMMIHHYSALVVLIVSFVLRCHNFGCLALFLHDICEVLLELSKLNVYFKTQDNKIVKKHEILANLSFLCFTITWFVARMYWYPLRLLYFGLTDVYNFQSVLPCLLFINCFLWSLQILNVYWSYLILLTLYRVATGQMQVDPREYVVKKKLNQRFEKEYTNNRVSCDEISNHKKDN